jgi:hypothetical protein
MASRKYFKLLGNAVMLMGLTAGGHAAETSCAAGSSLTTGLLQSLQAFAPDENAAIWRSAFECDWRPITDEAGNRAVSQFEDAARDNGLSGGLRTFARNGDFRLYLEGMKAMSLGPANRYLDSHDLEGTWVDSARGVSADSSLLFAVGGVSLSYGRRYQYVEVWQFDPKVANWGVKTLLLRPVPQK